MEPRVELTLQQEKQTFGSNLLNLPQSSIQTEVQSRP